MASCNASNVLLMCFYASFLWFVSNHCFWKVQQYKSFLFLILKAAECAGCTPVSVGKPVCNSYMTVMLPCCVCVRCLLSVRMQARKWCRSFIRTFSVHYPAQRYNWSKAGVWVPAAATICRASFVFVITLSRAGFFFTNESYTFWYICWLVLFCRLPIQFLPLLLMDFWSKTGKSSFKWSINGKKIKNKFAPLNDVFFPKLC